MKHPTQITATYTVSQVYKHTPQKVLIEAFIYLMQQNFHPPVMYTKPGKVSLNILADLQER